MIDNQQCNKIEKIGEGVPAGADSVSVPGPFFQVRFSKRLKIRFPG